MPVDTRVLYPLLDGDVLIYRAGFAVKDDEPPAFAVYNLKNTISKILEKFPLAQELAIYLSGPNNFRYELATLRPYKGNRKDERKPRDYDILRQHLIDIGAVITEGIEADDALGTHQASAPDQSTAICSIDKDLRMIPGWHYNWVKDSLDLVSAEDADLNFWRQMLIGDRTDNIPGIDSIGPVKTEKLIASVQGDPVLVRNLVQELYQTQYGDRWREAYEEVAGLLWIEREKGQRCPLI